MTAIKSAAKSNSKKTAARHSTKRQTASATKSRRIIIVESNASLLAFAECHRDTAEAAALAEAMLRGLIRTDWRLTDRQRRAALATAARVGIIGEFRSGQSIADC